MRLKKMFAIVLGVMLLSVGCMRKNNVVNDRETYTVDDAKEKMEKDMNYDNNNNSMNVLPQGNTLGNMDGKPNPTVMP